ncbi:SRPBCC family protein [Actinopolyspora mortivallis]|uniref:SRPBCC family protein n=1 Tax=Actinopolyspora mortivallis TaxID=33906 RepID=UPI00035CE52F|nr:SRPBCC family protein [Actinopolyspora mortivallis]
MVEPTASARLELPIPAERAYRMVTDLDTLATVSAEVHACEWLDEPPPRPGVRFRGFNRNGDRSWSTVATVRVADPERCFAFDVDDGDTPVSHWRYEIHPTDTGCVVVESTWDRRPEWYTPVSAETTGEPERGAANQRNIERTLRALRAFSERE